MHFSLKEEDEEDYLSKAISSLFIILIVRWLFPDLILFSPFEFWNIRTGGPIDWLYAGWPIFAWGTIATLILGLIHKSSYAEYYNAEELFATDILTSLWAGIMEEICFRWLIFLSCIAGAKISNFLFFGYFGFGLVEWFQLNILGVIANFTTFGYLKDVLIKPEMWAVGAGLLATNASFRDGHKYLGLLGYLNSWFIGMFLFWILFKYGLIACIIIHFTYDLLLGIVAYLIRKIKRPSRVF